MNRTGEKVFVAITATASLVLIVLDVAYLMGALK